MPNVVVYVRADDWKALGEDAEAVRRIAQEGIRREVSRGAPRLRLQGEREFRPDPKPSQRKR